MPEKSDTSICRYCKRQIVWHVTPIDDFWSHAPNEVDEVGVMSCLPGLPWLDERHVYAEPDLTSD